MKLSRLAMVNRIDLARHGLHEDLRALQAGDFVMTVRGNRQDEALLALVRPVLEREIKARIAALEADLEQLGVEVG